MNIDNKLQKTISDVVLNTADPERAERNLIRFIETNPDYKRLSHHFSLAAKLFATSQFLANFSITHTDELSAAISERKKDITKRLLRARAGKELPALQGTPFQKGELTGGQMSPADIMKALRLFKKRYMLRITLRDISGETDIQSSMDELTLLSEIIIAEALTWSLHLNQQKFGQPADSTIALIALGKLGGEELNYSSDVDLMAVYDNNDGQTSGILNPSGVLYNKVSNHEFYCKVIELFNKLLSSHTEDGIAYRVDFRLRPQGQRGDIALPLKAYQTYYQSWGRTWERMMLIRARPVAGDLKLGKSFIETIRPFVWRQTLEIAEIEEIRGLKKKIDSTFDRDDIKRGYGGIREAEFFIQTFQLLFGGENKSLRSYRILNAIQALKWMNKVPEEDLTTLWDNYIYLRRVEHYLQMKEDLQTHTLPSTDSDLKSLALNMGFSEKTEFLGNLRIRRMQIKSMYNSLFGTEKDVYSETLNLLEGGLNDNEVAGYLSFRKVRRPERGLVSIKNIREHMNVLHTAQERSLSRQVIPQLIENALMAESPDRALSGIESLLTTYDMKTAHLTAFLEQKELMAGVVKLFSLSPYLTRIFLSNHYYLDILIEEWSIAKTLSAMENKLERTGKIEEDRSHHLAQYKRFEEIRLGMLLLLGIVETEDLFKGLSQVAEAVIKSVVDSFGCGDLSVIALGKLGGREMTFGSDLDIVFVSETPEAMTAAEKTMKSLTAYTDMGLLYSVDTRLRPDGSKGILVNNVEGYRNYYLKKAQNWEIQALLKARPVGGDAAGARSFIQMAKDVLLQRGHDVEHNDIKAMRQRIIRELSAESEGIDIKLGPGGVEEIEFYVQFLQLHHAHEFPDLLVQNTLAAISRLHKKKLLTQTERDTLYNTYEYYRKLQTFLRLNEQGVISEESAVSELAAKFMGYEKGEELLGYLKGARDKVLSLY
jgi:glutamate-ammonia-ligase adenylyltransferase